MGEPDNIEEKEKREEQLVEAEEEEQVREASKLSPSTIYEVIRLDGEEELERNKLSLLWSGISAGIVIAFSVLGEAIFRTYLPDAPWSYLLENLGYSLGFLVVITGRMQLFTENTMTTVLPLLEDPTFRMFRAILALWGIVLLANVVGAFAVSTFIAYAGAIPDEIMPALFDLSRHATSMPASQGFARGIPAGVLIAAIVWMMPQAQSSSMVVVILFTWLIAAGDFTHIIAGSVEMALLVVTGELPVVEAVGRFFLPVLAGNVVGGTVIFTMLIYGQTRRDRQRREEERARGRRRMHVIDLR
ncbi:formate/nitrite transporter family protein [Maritimibacter sp. DP1N21-5]|uniref:formate/nitrite transporter family protein n=1 Tax=Maritimibacter sp. DP1N21-5 TaxID=2836867 RepID=UPI001C453646|nr:formate/nitrite transporter family protein [Maritimibacter sp. DP1N21-5]MBV7407539.1 formate/nitrite transporter family protein [Maritimibacter sp. DP1N21-5]